MATMIYSVSFHKKSTKQPHTFWFTDFDKAARFVMSLASDRKVTDCALYELDANVSGEYVPGMKDGGIRAIETWKRDPKRDWQITPGTTRNNPTHDAAIAAGGEAGG